MKQLIIFLICCASVFGATNTWIGGTSTSWNLDANWSLTDVPESGDAVVIAASANPPVVDAATVVCDSISNTTTGVLTIPFSCAITCPSIYANGTVSCIRISGTADATIVGNITNASANTDDDTISFTSSGSLTVTGDVSGGSAGSTNTGITVTHNDADVTINGNLYGGDGVASNNGLELAGTSSTVIVTGTVEGGTGAYSYGLAFVNAGAGVSDSATIGTVAIKPADTYPLGWITPATISISSFTVNGTAIGGTTTGSGRYDGGGRYNQ